MKKKISLLAVLGLALLAPSSYSYAQDESSLTNCNCPAGPQGVPGLRGKKGSPGLSATKSVASLFSLVNQQLSAGGSVLFEHTSAITPADYDVSLASTTGQITFLKTGTYNIYWGVEGELAAPFPNHVPGWALALYLDGEPVLGSCFSAYTIFPRRGHANSEGSRIIEVKAGQVLTLQSTSNLPISLNAGYTDSSVPVTVATLSIELE